MQRSTYIVKSTPMNEIPWQLCKTYWMEMHTGMRVYKNLEDISGVQSVVAIAKVIDVIMTGVAQRLQLSLSVWSEAFVVSASVCTVTLLMSSIKINRWRCIGPKLRTTRLTTNFHLVQIAMLLKSQL